MSLPMGGELSIMSPKFPETPEQKGETVPVSVEQVHRIAQLSKLSYTPEELELFVHHFQQILDHFEALGQVETSGVAPTYHALAGPEKTPVREDQLRPSLPADAAVSNAPQASDHQFQVPKVIE